MEKINISDLQFDFGNGNMSFAEALGSSDEQEERYAKALEACGMNLESEDED